MLGPNLMVWNSHWFPKFPGDRAYVSWHQDATYWGLSPANVTTAWIALSESTVENGCLRVVPGTHKPPLLLQRETADNMLSRGQEIAVKVDERTAVYLPLCAGEFSLDHIGMVHGSGPHKSTVPRIGLAVRYISPDVVQSAPSAILFSWFAARTTMGISRPWILHNMTGLTGRVHYTARRWNARFVI